MNSKMEKLLEKKFSLLEASTILEFEINLLRI